MEPPGPDEMTGERVVLRRITADDAVALNDLVISNLDHLIPFMPWAATDEKTLEFRQGLIERWEAEGESPFGIRVDGRMVGVIGTHRRIGPGGIEIGYWIDQHEEGKGYMTEAALLATEACFGDTSVERIEIRHDEANARSAVIPQRCGYTETLRQPREAQAPGETGTEVIWTMTRADFEARQK